MIRRPRQCERIATHVECDVRGIGCDAGDDAQYAAARIETPGFARARRTGEGAEISRMRCGTENLKIVADVQRAGNVRGEQCAAVIHIRDRDDIARIRGLVDFDVSDARETEVAADGQRADGRAGRNRAAGEHGDIVIDRAGAGQCSARNAHAACARDAACEEQETAVDDRGVAISIVRREGEGSRSGHGQ